MKTFVVIYRDPYDNGYTSKEIIGVASSSISAELLIQEDIDSTLGAKKMKNYEVQTFFLDKRGRS